MPVAGTAGNGARVRVPADREEDRRVGARLRDLRAAYDGMYQRELAERMRGAGHDWYQATVARIEAGRRSLTYLEAADVARICGVSPEWFSGESDRKGTAA